MNAVALAIRSLAGVALLAMLAIATCGIERASAWTCTQLTPFEVVHSTDLIIRGKIRDISTAKPGVCIYHFDVTRVLKGPSSRTVDIRDSAAPLDPPLQCGNPKPEHQDRHWLMFAGHVKGAYHRARCTTLIYHSLIKEPKNLEIFDRLIPGHESPEERKMRFQKLARHSSPKYYRQARRAMCGGNMRAGLQHIVDGLLIEPEHGQLKALHSLARVRQETCRVLRPGDSSCGLCCRSKNLKYCKNK